MGGLATRHDLGSTLNDVGRPIGDTPIGQGGPQHNGLEHAFRRWFIH